MKYCILYVCFIGALMANAGCKQAEPVATQPITAEAEATCDEVWDSPTQPDVLPRLIGGLRELQRRIKYPEEEREKGIEGQVMVAFVVNKQGRVIAQRVTESVSPGLDKEAMRVMGQTHFEPGRHDGSLICMKMTMPLTWHLNR